MENFTSYAISIAATITVNVLAKSAWLFISGFAKMMFSDLPRISGGWTAEFTEPTEEGSREKMSETISLHQLGRLVWGEGNVVDTRGRVFKYRGTILRHTIHGTYRTLAMKPYLDVHSSKV